MSVLFHADARVHFDIKPNEFMLRYYITVSEVGKRATTAHERRCYVWTKRL